MPHTPGPFTVEELGASAETERDLGVTRIVCAPSRYEGEEPVAVAFVVFPDDAPLFAASGDLLANAQAVLASADQSEDEPEVTLVATAEINALRAAVAKAVA